jgi:hypothetical protein
VRGRRCITITKAFKGPYFKLVGLSLVLLTLPMYKTKKILAGIQIVKATPVGLLVTSPFAVTTACPTVYASPAPALPRPRLPANVFEGSLYFLSKVVATDLVQENGDYRRSPHRDAPANPYTCYQYILTRTTTRSSPPYC